jgi:hypothetical protein
LPISKEERAKMIRLITIASIIGTIFSLTCIILGMMGVEI